LTSGSRELIVFVAVVTVVIYAFRMLSTAAVVYTVASIYSADAQNLSYARVIRIVPKVWNRLMITYLWDFIIFLAFYNASRLALFVLTFFSVGAGYKPKSGGFVCSSISITLIFACADVYISTVWNLACVVSVLEDKYHGLGAMWKSSNLIKGKRMTALALVILYFIFSRSIGGVFWYAVVDGRGHGMGTAARAVYVTVLVGLLCFVNLMGLLTQSVLYFVCTSYQLQQNIENKHCFEFYNVGDYMSLP
jgi:cell division protein FtsL